MTQKKMDSNFRDLINTPDILSGGIIRGIDDLNKSIAESIARAHETGIRQGMGAGATEIVDKLLARIHELEERNQYLEARIEKLAHLQKDLQFLEETRSKTRDWSSDVLSNILYGKFIPNKLLGMTDAAIFNDAANKITALEERIEKMQAAGDALVEHAIEEDEGGKERVEYKRVLIEAWRNA